jgi:hypothetical protein
MLNAQTHGEGLGLEVYTYLMEHREAVPGAVAHGKHHVLGFNPFPTRQPQGLHGVGLGATLEPINPC